MSSYVSAALRRFVAERAGFICEYCLIAEDDTFFGCQVDHIISEKHGGPTTTTNLAYACAFCNRAKGSDLGSLAHATGQLTRFYNPRTDRWSEHFVLNGVSIIPRTEVGEVTARIFGFNEGDRVLEREALVASSRFPGPAARLRLVPRSP